MDDLRMDAFFVDRLLADRVSDEELDEFLECLNQSSEAIDRLQDYVESRGLGELTPRAHGEAYREVMAMSAPAGASSARDVSSSPQGFIRDSIARAALKGSNVAWRNSLARWRSWFDSQTPSALTIRPLKLASAGGFLAPLHQDQELGDDVQAGLPAATPLYVELISPLEAVQVDIPHGAPLTVHVMIKGIASNSCPLLILVELGMHSLDTRIAEAVRNETLPFYEASFEGLATGSYLIAYSPYVVGEMA